jgi:hypothetical protein
MDDFSVKEYDEKDTMKVFKTIDRAYDFVYRMKETPSGRIRRTKIDVYTTETSSGSKIRNAETGNFYNHRVGSYHEHLYFKVAMSTGELKPRNCSNILFYDSPTQYEQHLNGVVSDSMKECWQERRDEYIRTRRTRETSEVNSQ